MERFQTAPFEEIAAHCGARVSDLRPLLALCLCCCGRTEQSGRPAAASVVTQSRAGRSVAEQMQVGGE